MNTLVIMEYGERMFISLILAQLYKLIVQKFIFKLSMFQVHYMTHFVTIVSGVILNTKYIQLIINIILAYKNKRGSGFISATSSFYVSITKDFCISIIHLHFIPHDGSIIFHISEGFSE